MNVLSISEIVMEATSRAGVIYNSGERYMYSGILMYSYHLMFG